MVFPMQELPLKQVSGLLGSGPVILVTTADGERRNVMTIAWHTMLDFNPPLLGIVMGGDHHSRALLEAGRSCVVAIPGADLAPLVMAVGTVSGTEMDKFDAFGITTAKAETVAAPLLADCLANFECRVIDTLPKYEMIVLEVTKAWVNYNGADQRMLHYRGNGVFRASGAEIDLSAK
jgi:flavin reductase (DIM6/NTAB) family NADH-FMN oxidoreductase RutF